MEEVSFRSGLLSFTKPQEGCQPLGKDKKRKKPEIAYRNDKKKEEDALEALLQREDSVTTGGPLPVDKGAKKEKSTYSFTDRGKCMGRRAFAKWW